MVVHPVTFLSFYSSFFSVFMLVQDVLTSESSSPFFFKVALFIALGEKKSNVSFDIVGEVILYVNSPGICDAITFPLSPCT